MVKVDQADQIASKYKVPGFDITSSKKEIADCYGELAKHANQYHNSDGGVSAINDAKLMLYVGCDRRDDFQKLQKAGIQGLHPGLSLSALKGIVRPFIRAQQGAAISGKISPERLIELRKTVDRLQVYFKIMYFEDLKARLASEKKKKRDGASQC